MGFLISTGPLVCCALVLLGVGVYAVRAAISWDALGSVAVSAAVVPFIEEALFRGLFLGVLLRGNRPLAATRVQERTLSPVISEMVTCEGTSHSTSNKSSRPPANFRLASKSARPG